MSNLNQKYEVRVKPITVSVASEIDYLSYQNGQYNSFLEQKNLISKVDFDFLENGTVVFSNQDVFQNLDYKIGNFILDKIREELFLSKAEVSSFSLICKQFLKMETGPMPPELLIAQHIKNGDLTLSLSDIENMPIKKYERIKIALNEIEAKEVQ